ncbi:hypothetical protein [Streptomyces sp. NPDC097610]|uniref:hypothetical protein n=1 Tax=Streptomyces sp. NPDC097610 TaxID=3157227 RepID=UPI00333346CE
MTTALRAQAPMVEADPDLIELTRLPAPAAYTADIYADCIAWPPGYAVQGRREDSTAREYELLRAVAVTLDRYRQARRTPPARLTVRTMRVPPDGTSTRPRPVRVFAEITRDANDAPLITISSAPRRVRVSAGQG